jgi:hypothetical protein
MSIESAGWDHDFPAAASTTRHRAPADTAYDGGKTLRDRQVIARQLIFPHEPEETIRCAIQIGSMPCAGCLATAAAMAMCESEKWRMSFKGNAST